MRTLIVERFSMDPFGTRYNGRTLLKTRSPLRARVKLSRAAQRAERVYAGASCKFITSDYFEVFNVSTSHRHVYRIVPPK